MSQEPEDVKPNLNFISSYAGHAVNYWARDSNNCITSSCHDGFLSQPLAFQIPVDYSTMSQEPEDVKPKLNLVISYEGQRRIPEFCERVAICPKLQPQKLP